MRTVTRCKCEKQQVSNLGFGTSCQHKYQLPFKHGTCNQSPIKSLKGTQFLGKPWKLAKLHNTRDTTITTNWT